MQRVIEDGVKNMNYCLQIHDANSLPFSLRLSPVDPT